MYDTQYLADFASKLIQCLVLKGDCQNLAYFIFKTCIKGLDSSADRQHKIQANAAFVI